MFLIIKNNQYVFYKLCKYYIFEITLIRNQHFLFNKGVCKLINIFAANPAGTYI